MKVYVNSLCSMVLAFGFLAAAIDSEADGPMAVQVVTVDTHGNTTAYITALEPLIDLLRGYAPQATIEVLEATFAGDETGTVYLVIRYPDMSQLAAARQMANRSAEWANAVRRLEATGRTLRAAEILEDRTPR